MSEINVMIPKSIDAFEVAPFAYGSGEGKGSTLFEDYSCFVDGMEIGFHIVNRFSDAIKNEVKITNYGISLVNFEDRRVLGHARVDNDLIYQLEVEQMQALMSLLLRVGIEGNEDSKTGKALQYIIDTLDFDVFTSLMTEPERNLTAIHDDDVRSVVVQYTFGTMVLTMCSADTSSSSSHKIPPVIAVTSNKDINTIRELLLDTGDYSVYVVG